MKKTGIAIASLSVLLMASCANRQTLAPPMPKSAKFGATYVDPDSNPYTVANLTEDADWIGSGSMSPVNNTAQYRLSLTRPIKGELTAEYILSLAVARKDEATKIASLIRTKQEPVVFFVGRNEDTRIHIGILYAAGSWLMAEGDPGRMKITGSVPWFSPLYSGPAEALIRRCQAIVSALETGTQDKGSEP